jgi:hypothetical protein
MVKYLVLCALLLPAPAMAQSVWQNPTIPATPPNDISQGEPQSVTVIPNGPSQGNGLGQLENQSGTVIDNGTGEVLGTYSVAP